jgi:white-opaque regulator 2
MQNSYSYQSPQGQPPASQEEPTTSGSVMAQASMINLPPLRTFEHQHLPSISPVHGQMAHQSPVAHQSPYVGSPSTHYQGASPQYSSYYQQPVPQQYMHQQYVPVAVQAQIRYPHVQAAPDSRLLGGRQRKEIKRRTKTGCLTCRKRRIKVCGALELLESRS